MALEEKAEELLEAMWIYTEDKKEAPVSLERLGVTEPEIKQLVSDGYLELVDGKVQLTDRGRPYARNIVRRHRLAERLLADVLSTGGEIMHEKACKFEHILDQGLDESICILLGHPRVCPHGNPIPPGRCCLEHQSRLDRVVASLSHLTAGQEGKVAYLYAPESNKLQKLMALGILPGVSLKLIQSFPSYVFQVGQTQFAVDKEIADSIYVRLSANGTADEMQLRGPTRQQRRKGNRWSRLRLGRG
ncbi:MAG: metal-dependent transcriptional regulator [Chloroflexota bacterium]